MIREISLESLGDISRLILITVTKVMQNSEFCNYISTLLLLHVDLYDLRQCRTLIFSDKSLSWRCCNLEMKK